MRLRAEVAGEVLEGSRRRLGGVVMLVAVATSRTEVVDEILLGHAAAAVDEGECLGLLVRDELPTGKAKAGVRCLEARGGGRAEGWRWGRGLAVGQRAGGRQRGLAVGGGLAGARAQHRAGGARGGERTFISSLEVSPSPRTAESVSDMKRTLSSACKSARHEESGQAGGRGSARAMGLRQRVAGEGLGRRHRAQSTAAGGKELPQRRARRPVGGGGGQWATARGWRSRLSPQSWPKWRARSVEGVAAAHVGSIRDQLTQKDLLLRVQAVDDDVHELVYVRLELVLLAGALLD